MTISGRFVVNVIYINIFILILGPLWSKMLMLSYQLNMTMRCLQWFGTKWYIGSENVDIATKYEMFICLKWLN